MYRNGNTQHSPTTGPSPLVEHQHSDLELSSTTVVVSGKVELNTVVVSEKTISEGVVRVGEKTISDVVVVLVFS